MAVRLAVAAGFSAVLLACSTSTKTASQTPSDLAHKGDLSAPPDSTVEKTAPGKGPARYLVGKAYQVAGNWFEPKDDPEYDRIGTASWYGEKFHGKRTANGEVFDRTGLTAAHPTLPLPSYVRVTNLQNQRSIVVRVNDRGPFSRKRLIDVSERTADVLDFKRRGMAQVRVEYVDRAEMDANDDAFLIASYRDPGKSDARVQLAQAEVPPRPEGISAPGHVPPPKAKRPKAEPELAFDAAGAASAAPQVAEAVVLISQPVSADARITMAFDTAAAPAP